MLPTDRVRTVQGKDCIPGTVLFRRVGGELIPYLAGQLADQKIIMAIHDLSAFGVKAISHSDDLFLSVSGTRFEIDYRRHYSLERQEPLPGTLVAQGDAFVLVGQWREKNIYLGLNGTGISYLDWKQCVGFPEWRLTIDDAAAEEIVCYMSPADRDGRSRPF